MINATTNLNALSREQAAPEAQTIFDNLKQKIGMVPNLYATAANSPSTLNAILTFGALLDQGNFSKQEIEAVALSIAQENSCDYCLAAHTALGKMSGLSEEDTLALRTATIEDSKLLSLTTLAKDITVNRGFPAQESINAFFDAGYDQSAFVELLGYVSLNTFNNYINEIAQTEIDFPLAPSLST